MSRLGFRCATTGPPSHFVRASEAPFPKAKEHAGSALLGASTKLPRRKGPSPWAPSPGLTTRPRTRNPPGDWPGGWDLPERSSRARPEGSSRWGGRFAPTRAPPAPPASGPCGGGAPRGGRRRGTGARPPPIPRPPRFRRRSRRPPPPALATLPADDVRGLPEPPSKAQADPAERGGAEGKSANSRAEARASAPTRASALTRRGSSAPPASPMAARSRLRAPARARTRGPLTPASAGTRPRRGQVRGAARLRPRRAFAASRSPRAGGVEARSRVGSSGFGRGRNLLTAKKNRETHVSVSSEITRFGSLMFGEGCYLD